MASAPTNPTQLTPPRVPLIDDRSGAISREWYRFFLSLLTATQDASKAAEIAPDSVSLIATLNEIVDTIRNEMQTAPEADVSSVQNQIAELQQAFGVTPPNPGGTVTSVAASGGTTGLTFTGSPITTSGTLTLGGTLAVANGGTGQTSYTDGQVLIGNTTGNTLTKATLTAGTNVTINNGSGAITINATDAFVGTVTSVSVVSANGFAGTVATSTTTPAITMTTSVTGVLKGNGTAISAAVAATDYVAPSAYASANGLTMATNRLLGRTTASTGAAEEISVAGGLTLSGGVLTGVSGTVTSVTGTAPVVSSGGSTPAISMPAATTSVDGYLSSTDWNTFNNKGSGTVTSVSGSGGTTGLTLSGGPITTTGTLTLGGTLAIANGGTGLTTTPANGVLDIGNGTGFTRTTLTPGSGVSISNTSGAITISATGTGGTVTSVAALTLGTAGTDLSSTVANGTTTPVITLEVPTASAANRGALSAADWTTFNNKGSGSVTSVGGTGTVNGITLTGTVTTSGNLTLGGTLSGVDLTSQVTGALPVANGGTGATTLTSGYLLKGNGTSAVSASILYDTGTNLGVGVTTPTAKVQIYSDGPPAASGDMDTGVVVAAAGGSYALNMGSNSAGAYTWFNSAFVNSSQTAANMLFFTGATERMKIGTTGAITAAGVYNNAVGATNRDVFVDDTGLLGYVSSIRASKTNICSLDDVGWIDALRPVKFNYRKRDAENAFTDDSEAPLEYGLIAEEVEAVNPELVFYDSVDDDLELRGVSYSKLVIPLLQRVQELTERVRSLEAADAKGAA